MIDFLKLFYTGTFKVEKEISKAIIKQVILQYKKIFIYAFIFSFIINALTLISPIYSLQILDRVVSSGSIETLIMLSIIAAAAFICLGLLSAVRSFIFAKLGENLDNDLSKKIVNASISIACVQKTISGSQMLRDFTVVKGFLTGPTIHTLFDAPWTILFIGVIYFIHPTAGHITLSAAIILLIMAYLNEALTKNDLNSANENSVKSFNQIELAARNAEVIEAMGMKQDIINNWNIINQASLNLQAKAATNAIIISSASKIIRLFIQMIIMGVGGYLVLKREITGGGIIACSILAGKALAPFDAGIATWKSVISARKSYQRLNIALEKAPQREEGIELPAPKGALSIEKLFYAPPGSTKPILKGINCEIKPGEIIGIIGPSGAGKTTFAKLITGIYKSSSGNVRLDGADIYKWNRSNIGKHIGYLPQDTELFNGMVKTNIARMQENADSEVIIKAAQLANAHEMILKLENGYETEIGLQGSQLSAGQIQRIGLARAFYNDPKVLILDEPNSHLDQEGEIALIKSINYAKSNRITTIIIAHRPSVLKYVDKIMVLKDGIISLFDTRNEVFKKLQ